jgi:glycosyltransferase involved in cell wall biosynthesis
VSPRIGILTYGLDRPLTGIGRYSLELLKALSNLRPSLDITLLCAGPPGPLSGVVAKGEVPLTGARILPLLVTWGQVMIARKSKELGLDVLHDLTGVSPLAFAKSHSATVTTIHDVFAWSLPGYSSLLDTLIYKQWLTRRWAKTDAVITVSGQSRADVETYLKVDSERVRVIPHGVTSGFHPMEIPAVNAVVRDTLGIRRPYVLYVGALTQRKNIARLVHAFASVRREHPQLLLVLAGPRSWKKTPIAEILFDLNLEEHVLLTGPVTDRELAALYNGALVFVFPSLYEGFGLPVLEAMACGTPVLTSCVSSLPEVVGDAGRMVDPYDVEAIAVALSDLVGNASLRDRYCQLGLQRASQFTWEATARQTWAVYESLGGQ